MKFKLSPYIREFLEPLRLIVFNTKFRKTNMHNKTFAGNRFDLSKVHIGKETYGEINVFSYNDSNAGNLIIGSYCSIARTVMLLTAGNHDYKSFSTFPFQRIIYNENCNGSKGNIQIDDDVWIGERATILSGTHIGQGAIVAAGAVCSGNIPPYSIVGGVPARVIKYRFSEDIISKLKLIDYDKINTEFLQENKKFVLENIHTREDLEWLTPCMKLHKVSGSAPS